MSETARHFDAGYRPQPEFNEPAPDATLWRYLDFTKFVSLLDKEALFFSTVANLGDPFEGAYSNMNIRLGDLLYSDYPEAQLQLHRGIREFRESALVNCWHQNDSESAAMWKLYSREHDGVAIKTDFSSLRKSFLGNADNEEMYYHIYIGKVSYVDYNDTFIPENNLLAPFMHKRKAFEHENEVRAINIRPKEDSPVLNGGYFNVKLDVLIREIVVAPYAQQWFFDLVDSIAKTYNLNAPVRMSALGATPLWRDQIDLPSET